MSDPDVLEQLKRMEELQKEGLKDKSPVGVGEYRSVNPELKFRFVNPDPPMIILKIGVNSANPTQQLEVFGFSGVRIATMDYDGVITSHVEDPVKVINEMLNSEKCQAWECGQLRAYLLLLRTYFSLPQPDTWKKDPLF